MKILKQRDSRRQHAACIFAALTVVCPSALAPDNEASTPGTELTLRDTLDPVSTTYAKLFRILTQSRNLIAAANANTKTKRVSESLRLQDDRLTLTLPASFTEHDVAGAPEIAYDVYYDYRNYDAPISVVTIRLSDNHREISVSGHSSDQVRALHGVLINELGDQSTWLGGVGFRVSGAVILNIMTVLLVVAGFWVRHRIARGVCLLFAPVLYFSIWFLPWGVWFPGTAVYSDSASFAVRHAASISLAGLVLTIVTFVAGAILARPTAPADSPEEPPAKVATAEVAATDKPEKPKRKRTRKKV